MVTHGPSALLSADLLARQLPGWQAAGRRSWERGRDVVSSGFRPLDRLLPAGGIRRGSLIELLAGDDAAGTVTLGCAVACQLVGSRQDRQKAAGDAATARSVAAAMTILVVDRGGRFYPPAMMPWVEESAGGGVAGHGVPQLVVARPSTGEDEIWAIDQALRCPGVAAVLAWPERVHANAMRRWQLAARASGAIGLLIRGLDQRFAEASRRRRTQPLSVGSARADAAERRPARRSKTLWPTWAEARVAVASVPPAVAGADTSGPMVRQLRLSLAGGAWTGEAMLEDHAVELVLDMANGREATGCSRAAIVSDAMQSPRYGERECRAS